MEVVAEYDWPTNSATGKTIHVVQVEPGLFIANGMVVEGMTEERAKALFAMYTMEGDDPIPVIEEAPVPESAPVIEGTPLNG